MRASHEKVTIETSLSLDYAVVITLLLLVPEKLKAMKFRVTVLL